MTCIRSVSISLNKSSFATLTSHSLVLPPHMALWHSSNNSLLLISDSLLPHLFWLSKSPNSSMPLPVTHHSAYNTQPYYSRLTSCLCLSPLSTSPKLALSPCFSLSFCISYLALHFCPFFSSSHQITLTLTRPFSELVVLSEFEADPISSSFHSLFSAFLWFLLR